MVLWRGKGAASPSAEQQQTALQCPHPPPLLAGTSGEAQRRPLPSRSPPEVQLPFARPPLGSTSASPPLSRAPDPFMPIGFSLAEISLKQPWRFPQCLPRATPPYSPWRPSGSRPLCLATPPSCFPENNKEPDLPRGPPSPFSREPRSARLIHWCPSRLNSGVTQVFPWPRPCPPPEGSAIWLRRPQSRLSHPRLPYDGEPSPTGFLLTADRVARSPLVPSQSTHPRGWARSEGGRWSSSPSSRERALPPTRQRSPAFLCGPAGKSALSARV